SRLIPHSVDLYAFLPGCGHTTSGPPRAYRSAFLVGLARGRCLWRRGDETGRDRTLLVPGSLEGEELGVVPAPGHDFVMGTGLDHPAVVEHDDTVGQGHRVQSVRDEQNGGSALE